MILNNRGIYGKSPNLLCITFCLHHWIKVSFLIDFTSVVKLFSFRLLNKAVSSSAASCGRSSQLCLSAPGCSPHGCGSPQHHRGPRGPSTGRSFCSSSRLYQTRLSANEAASRCASFIRRASAVRGPVTARRGRKCGIHSALRSGQFVGMEGNTWEKAAQ